MTASVIETNTICSVFKLASSMLVRSSEDGTLQYGQRKFYPKISKIMRKT